MGKLIKRDPELLIKIHKQLSLFLQNERHPSLRFHKLKGEMKDFWSISIDMNYRMAGVIEDGEMVFMTFGTHDEVYEEN